MEEVRSMRTLEELGTTLETRIQPGLFWSRLKSGELE
jgi:hypothetical protein